METTREYQDSPTKDLWTPFGRMTAVVTGSDHIYLKPAVEDGTSLRVNRVEMHATMHLRDYGDGQGFAPDQGERKHHGVWNSVYATRPDQTDVTTAAKEKLWTTLPGVVNEWLKGQNGLLKEARGVELNNAILQRGEDLREAEEKAAEIREEVLQLLEAEGKL